MAVNHWVRGSNPRGGGIKSRPEDGFLICRKRLTFSAHIYMLGGFFNALLCFTLLCNSLIYKELTKVLHDIQPNFLTGTEILCFLVFYFTMFYHLCKRYVSYMSAEKSAVGWFL